MEPATRKERLLAISIDCALIVAASFIAASEDIPESVRFVGLAAGACLLAANIFYLSKLGQTLGKRIVGIRIVRMHTHQNGGFVTNVVKRGFVSSLPYLLLSLLHPFLGALYFWADILFIFRENRRCLHDMIAGTIVVQ